MKKTASRTVSSILFAALLGGLAGTSGCGGPGGGSGGCRYESWRGRCKLSGVRTARVVERFPQSFVVLEATYEPVASGPQFPPPPFRREITVLAGDEQVATGQLQQVPEIDCAVQNPVGDPCAPTMEAAVPQFMAQGGTGEPTGPVGCQKIEQSGGNALPPSSVVMPGPFQFSENSAEQTSEIVQLADQAARAIQADPRIECVAIKAKTSAGEDFTLANSRAQLVRKLLESRGVAHSRVTVFEATAPSRVAAPDADQPNPVEQRRVHLTVVVYARQ